MKNNQLLSELTHAHYREPVPLKKPLHHKEVSIQRQRIPRYICEIHVPNRPFPSSKKSHFQIEAKCEAIDMKMIFNHDANKTHFHNKVFALSLVLKVRFFETRKWRIVFGNSREILRHASPRCRDESLELHSIL